MGFIFVFNVMEKAGQRGPVVSNGFDRNRGQAGRSHCMQRIIGMMREEGLGRRLLGVTLSDTYTVNWASSSPTGKGILRTLMSPPVEVF